MNGRLAMPDNDLVRLHGPGIIVRFGKRVFDLLAASIALSVLSLPMIAVALAVRAEDGGPVFFRQKRVGRGCRPFHMLKFRSMVVNAEKIGGFATAAGDARITRVGRFIRRTSLDELPQLLNVLRGDMSLVGPRPDVPAQQSLYRPEDWRLRHVVRPGITGLAQATSRSNATAEERTQMDLEYAASASLMFDIKIILLTVRQLMKKSSN